jgi:hypothetical protein
MKHIDEKMSMSPDYSLLREMEKSEYQSYDGKKIVCSSGKMARLINSVYLYEVKVERKLDSKKDITEKDLLELKQNITNKDLLEFYKYAEEAKNWRYFLGSCQYGAKTHKLLKDYLVKKEII